MVETEFLRPPPLLLNCSERSNGECENPKAPRHHDRSYNTSPAKPGSGSTDRDQCQPIAAILWGGFQLSTIALIARLLAQHRRRRTLALTLLFISVLGALAFSYVGGFSIGRFTAIIPVLVIGHVVAMGRGPAAAGS